MAILGILLFIAIGGTVVMLLWNWLLPALFGFHPLTFWQAIGILALSRILFGGHGFHRSRFRRRRERWERMTPEERERFRQAMRERWGCDPAACEPQEQQV
jgi:membrane protein required for beta-lactamase induction